MERFAHGVILISVLMACVNSLFLGFAIPSQDNEGLVVSSFLNLCISAVLIVGYYLLIGLN